MITGRRRLRDRLREEDGYAGTAIAYPAVILLCLALFQFGLYYVASNTAEAAAETAYQQARAYQATAAGGITAGQGLLGPGSLLHDGRITITRTAAQATVAVTGQAITILPGLPVPPIVKTLTGPTERWVPR